MKTIRMSDSQYNLLKTLVQEFETPTEDQGWYEPDRVPSHYHSTPTKVIPVLVAAPHYSTPMSGYYMAVVDKWYVIGSPSSVDPIAWQPLPDMPEEL